MRIDVNDSIHTTVVVVVVVVVIVPSSPDAISVMSSV